MTLWVQAGLGGIGDHNRHRHVNPEAVLNSCHQSISILINDQLYTIVCWSHQESGLTVTVPNLVPVTGFVGWTRSSSVMVETMFAADLDGKANVKERTLLTFFCYCSNLLRDGYQSRAH